MMNELSAKSSPKDVFLHLLAIASLYISAISFITLLFQYIDYWFPDPLSPFVAGDAIRWAIASLIIIFPVHILATRLLQKDFRQVPAKREGRLRKWLLYLTLFVASITLIADLVALIYNFLNGDLTTRFFLKVLAIGIVAGGVFFYYLWDLRKKSAEISSQARGLLWAASVLVLIGVIGGFFITGSPFTQRLVRFDEARIADLSTLQGQIVNYWQQKNALPSSLDALRDDISGFVPPHDPETGAAYEYKKTGDLSFELCATFSTELTNSVSPKGYIRTPFAPYGAPGGTWNHGKGRVCFSRTIDPQLYRAPVK